MKRFICFLIIIYISVSGFAQSNYGVSSNFPSGSYNHDVRIELKSETSDDILYYFDINQNKEKQQYKEPLLLSAMAGERREYTISTFIKKDGIVKYAGKLTYVIDKANVKVPVPELESGVYKSDIRITFSHTENRIFYTLSGITGSSFIRWNGEPILVRQSDKQQNITLAAYCENNKGVTSNVVTRDYLILPENRVPETLKVYSPVEGLFLNSQLLYIDTSGFKWIRYSIGNNDPAKFGTTYRDPVLFKAKGDYILNIAGLPEDSTGIIKKTIEFSIKDLEPGFEIKKSGIYSEPVQIRIPASGYQFALSDKDPVSEYIEYNNKTFVFSPVNGLRTYNVLRFIPDSVQHGYEYRYFYLFDRKMPGSPVINYVLDNDKRKIEIDISSKNGTRAYYTYDGTTPDKYSILYKKPFCVPYADDILSGSVIIKAVCIAENDMESGTVSKLITYDFESPGPPEIKIEKINSRKYKLIFSNCEDNRIFYLSDYSGIDPGNPGLSSFSGKRSMFLKFPRGVAGEFRMNAVLVDNFGNISEKSGITIPFNTFPPSPPEILSEEDNIILSGNGRIFYSFDSSSDYVEYTTPLLKEEFYKYRILKAYTVDEEGTKSNSAVFSIPHKKIEKPGFKYFGIENNKYYNSPVTLKTFPAPGTVLFYSVKSGNEYSDKKELPDKITFDCPLNVEKVFELRIIAEKIDDPADVSETDFKFVIDKNPPLPPDFGSVITGKTYNGDVVLSQDNCEDNIWLLIKNGDLKTKNPDIRMFYNEGFILNESYTLSGAVNQDTAFTVYAAAVDKAGNFSLMENPLKIIIDRKPPSPPEIIGIPPKGKSNKNVVLTLHSEDAAEIYYVIKRNGILIDGLEKQHYSGPIDIPVVGDTPVDYRIKAWSVDAAGNISSENTIADISVCRKSLSPVDPEILSMNDRTSIISFPVMEEFDIYYKIGKSPFVQYKKPFSVNIINSGHDALYYYILDSYLNKSRVKKIPLSSENKKNGLVTGINDKGIYSTGVTVKKRFPGSNIYYEISESDDLPVTVLSPKLDSPLKIDFSKGQVHSYVLKVREYDTETLKPLSNEETYRFTIDKKMPLIPKITGVSDKDFYQNVRNISIYSSEGTVYYELDKNDVSLTEGFKKYSGSFTVDVNNGDFAEYRISAYTKDAAGNKSPVVSVGFAIDKAIIYLSSRGKDSYDGTRTRPLRTLDAALFRALKNGRKIIYATVGEYEIEDTLQLQDNISIVGGFGYDIWNKSSGKTVISSGSNHDRKAALLVVNSGIISLENCTFTNLDLDSSVITQNGGSLNINNCEFIFANGRGLNLLRTDSGNLTLTDTRIMVGAAYKSTLFPVTNGSIKLKRVGITVDGAVNKITIFSLENSIYSEMDNLVVNIGKSQVSELFNMYDSSLEIRNSTLNTGDSRISSQLFSLRNSALTIDSTTVKSGWNSGIVSVVDGEDSKTNIYHSVIDCSAQKGISVFRLNRSSLNTVDLGLNISNTSDFTTFIRGDDTEINYRDSRIVLEKSFDLDFIVLNGSDISFVDNSVNVFDVNNGKSLVSLSNMKNIKITGNNFKNVGKSEEPVFRIRGNNNAALKKNSFAGWKLLMEYNDLLINNSEELNTFSGFSSSPYGNVSK